MLLHGISPTRLCHQVSVYGGVYYQVLEVCDIMHHVKEVREKVVQVKGLVRIHVLST